MELFKTKAIKYFVFIASTTFLVAFSTIYLRNEKEAIETDERIINYVLNPKKQDLKFYYKDETNKNFKNIEGLKEWLENKGSKLHFAMNGGMFNKDFSPQGLYIENGEQIAPLDTIINGYGNFYLQPNGVFYLTSENYPVVCTTKEFKQSADVKYATQSGPMLVINGKMHPKFNLGSKNVHIRNGVGILPNGNLLFAMSKEKINFYDFASFFQNNGCKNALYLDGFVSRTYLPSKDWIQEDGGYAIIMAEVEKN